MQSKMIDTLVEKQPYAKHGAAFLKATTIPVKGISCTSQTPQLLFASSKHDTAVYWVVLRNQP